MNRLLQLLSDEDAASLAPMLVSMSLAPGAVLQRSREPIAFVHFPLGGMLLLTVPLEDGSEVGVCGLDRSGALHANPDADPAAGCKAEVALPGRALKLPASAWRAWVAERPHVRGLLARYNDLLETHLQQHIACHMRHDVESRLCYWLLRMHDCAGEAGIPMTHQALARLMGVRRTTVTLVAKSLQDAGIISYRRGAIQVLDHFALHQSSCECYRAWRARNEKFRAAPPARGRQAGAPA
jgi:CRP-like cAMP-binding protein